MVGRFDSMMSWSDRIQLPPTILSCRPIKASLSHPFQLIRTVPAAKCVDSFGLNTGSSVTHIITDLAPLALPLQLLWRLEMARPRKYMLSAMFALDFM